MSERLFGRCNDCGEPTLPEYQPSEYYMVREDVWAPGGLAPHGGYLCIGCLEKRLGRRLRSSDFSDAPVNNPTWGWKSKRLRDRLGSRRASQARRARPGRQIAGQLSLWEGA